MSYHFSPARRTIRILSSLTSALLLCQPLIAFQSPLSDTAVREAYFLGQRHDEAVTSFFAKYSKSLPVPRSGPYIAVVRFLTPFAQMVSQSGSFIGNYSAQRAEQDHDPKSETVVIAVDIYFTETYGPFLVGGSQSGSTTSLVPRSSDFWRDFDFTVGSDSRLLSPRNISGRALYNCSDAGCTLSGATVTLTFAPELFADWATIDVVPPEGDAVSINFELNAFR